MPEPLHFPSTHWSLIREAGQGRREALDDLLGRYLPALRAYLLRTTRLSAEEAADALQDFCLEKVVRKRLMEHADRRRGRFRTYLLAVLRNYLVSRHRREHTRRRAPDKPLVSLEELAAPAGARDDPQDAYNLAWARQVLAQVIEAMQAECERTGRPDLWGVFSSRVLGPMLDDVPPTPYAELIERYGFGSPLQASNALLTAKRMYARLLRQVVGEYARDPAEVDEEIADLRQILANCRA